MTTDYDIAIDQMAQQTLEDFDLEAIDGYLSLLTIDVPDRDLIFFINLVESDRIKPTSASVAIELHLFRDQHHCDSYKTIVEDYIRDNWPIVLDTILCEAVKRHIDLGGRQHPEYLGGGSYEAETDFIAAVCSRMCLYLHRR